MDKAIARAVTHRVPVMKGKKPNFPSQGYHEDEKSSSFKGWVVKISVDFWIRAKAMTKTSKTEKTVVDNMNLLAMRSLSLLTSMLSHYVRKVNQVCSVVHQVHFEGGVRIQPLQHIAARRSRSTLQISWLLQ